MNKLMVLYLLENINNRFKVPVLIMASLLCVIKAIIIRIHIFLGSNKFKMSSSTIALRRAKTLRRYGLSECIRLKL